MGLRDWFTSSPKNPKSAEREADEDTASEDEQAFAALQNAKTEEALSLFEEDEQRKYRRSLWMHLTMPAVPTWRIC